MYADRNKTNAYIYTDLSLEPRKLSFLEVMLAGDATVTSCLRSWLLLFVCSEFNMIYKPVSVLMVQSVWMLLS